MTNWSNHALVIGASLCNFQFKRNWRYTCAGITAGIDLSLALIEEDFGPRIALSVARELVVYLKRPGGQEQFS